MILFAIIVLTGFFLRFYALDMKIMHHDESVLNTVYIQPILEGKQLYWNPEQHGLLMHYFTAPFVKLFGMSVFSLRFASALFGSLTILLLYFLRKEIGDIGVLVSAAFLAISPTFVFYSRQYTGYPFYIFFLLLFIIVGIKIINNYDHIKLYGLAILAAIILNINEAFFIFLFILSAFIFLCCVFEPDRTRNIKLYFERIKDSHFIYAVVLFIFVFILFHTYFFTNFFNLTNLGSSLSNFAAKSVNTRHYHSFSYYLTILFPVEVGLLIMFIIGLFTFKNSIFSKFLIFWSASSIVIFSLIGYKTNWMLPVIIFPWILLAGVSADYLFKIFHPSRKILTITLLLLLSITLFYCITENYFIYNSAFKNRLGYLETSTDVLEMKKDIDAYAGGRNISILIMVDRPHPLPYYLDGYNITIIRLLTSMPDVDIGRISSYDVIIIHKGQFFNLSDRYAVKEYYFKEKDPDNSKVNIMYKLE